ncbi:hypothetical protein [Caloranaerobacter sp. DY30410]|uniref:hypothetical protein n=1 Tax=Caloranaerobacter sp. DY30410 TaxID=3238305 RepID=UPI003D08F554
MLELFVYVSKLANKLGISPIKDTIWEHQIDDKWKIVVNGHDTIQNYNGLDLEPFHMYIEYNGFPAGIVNPYDGIICAGSEANEDKLIEAIKLALNKI